MDPVYVFLLCVAGIFLIGALGELIFQATNIPDVIWLILAGIVLGPVMGLITKDMLRQAAPFFAALTLVVVLFEGGSALKLSELSQAATRSTGLAILSFGFAAATMTLTVRVASAVGLLPETWGWLHGLLVGAILGGSSSIIIMPAMAQARLEPKLANLVNLESALTDALCVVGTSALVGILLGGATNQNPAVTLAKSFGIGAGIGLVAGLVWLLFLRVLRKSQHAYTFTLSALLILYVVIDHAGGSAALGILVIAVVLGNAKSLGKAVGLVEEASIGSDVKGIHSQMAFMVKSFFFVFIGAMLGPPWGLVVFGIALGALLYVSRIPAVRIATLGAGFSGPQVQMTTLSMPRGMAAGVLATLPVSAGIPDTEQLPAIVFACVLSTILIFAVRFPMVKSQLAQGEPNSIPLPAGAAMPATVQQASAQGSPATPTSGSQSTIAEPTPFSPHDNDPAKQDGDGSGGSPPSQ